MGAEYNFARFKLVFFGISKGVKLYILLQKIKFRDSAPLNIGSYTRKIFKIH
jgi:hypothetical protein